MTPTAAECSTAATGTSALSSVGDPQDLQKRVSTVKTAPQDWQALISLLLGIQLGRWAATGICFRLEELANQLWANSVLTAISLFSVGLRTLINSFSLVFVLNSTLKILA
jgi:hypothetical protein